MFILLSQIDQDKIILGISDFLNQLVNASTSDDKNAFHNRDKLLTPFNIDLSKKQKKKKKNVNLLLQI